MHLTHRNNSQHMLNRPVRRMFAMFAMGAIAATAAEGFESNEHQEMSNLAVSVVLQMAKDGGRVKASHESVRELEAYQQHYGITTACVDYFMMPEKVINYGWKLPPGQTTEEDYPQVQSRGIPSLKSPIRNELIERCDPKNLATIQATHNNHAHFQQDLLTALRLWHLAATAVSTKESNVYGGLFINSISDHYLHDFFAPGHLVTPRDRLTDLPATATHDLANEMGALFRPSLSSNKTPGALRVLEYLCQVNEGSFSTAISECNPNPKIESLLRNNGSSINILISDLKIDAIALKNNDPILLRGDGHLDQKDLSRQRTLMLAIQAASILDILEGTNSLADVYFSYEMRKGLPSAKTSFGQYDFSYAGEKIATVLDRKIDPTTASQSESEKSNKYLSPVRFTPCSLGGCRDRFYELRTRSPILSISMQGESHVNRASHQRRLISIDGSTGAVVWDANKFSGGWLEGVEITPLFGYAYYQENGFRGNGPVLRLTASVPETEFSISSYARWLSYPMAGGSTRKISLGLRADAGFSSYFTFFISGGTDHAVTSTGSLSKSLILGAGIRVGAPMTRLNPGH